MLLTWECIKLSYKVTKNKSIVYIHAISLAADAMSGYMVPVRYSPKNVRTNRLELVPSYSSKGPYTLGIVCT